MARKLGFYLMLVLVFSMMTLLAGCGGNSADSEKPAASAPPANETSVEDLLAKGQGLPGMSYDQVITTGDTAMTTKVWQQGKNMRLELEDSEGAGKVITIVNGDEETVYTYAPDQGIATKFSLEESEVDTSTPQDYAQDMNNETMKYIKEETIDGKECSLYEMNATDDSESLTKVWIWKDYGIPIRMESTAEGQEMLMEYKNVQVGAQDASLFQLPKDVAVMDIENMSIPGVDMSQTSPGN